jgi:hypothetical protein
MIVSHASFKMSLINLSNPNPDFQILSFLRIAS